MSRAIILLKSLPRDPTTDAYVQQASTLGYAPYFIEVLESVFSNEQSLVDIIRKGPVSFTGVVVTSGRAAEAWIHALENISTPGNWVQTPFYVVGEATARALKPMTTSHPDHFSESLILGAAQSGKSESLAQFVLVDLLSRAGNGGTLLYLTGDKNRDTFHRLVNESGVDVESLRVYETMIANGLQESIESVAQEIEKGQEKSAWIVFFAPSSSDFALPHLRQYFEWSESIVSPENSQHTRIPAKLAAIGPTTANFLRSERHFRVDAVASKPSAEQLVASIREFDMIDRRED